MSIENYKWSKLPDIGKLSRLSLQHFMNGFCWILSVVIETLGELLCEDHGNVKCKSGRILTFLVNFTGGPLCGGTINMTKSLRHRVPFVESTERG